MLCVCVRSVCANIYEKVNASRLYTRTLFTFTVFIWYGVHGATWYTFQVFIHTLHAFVLTQKFTAAVAAITAHDIHEEWS